jgi:hypothetical protein
MSHCAWLGRHWKVCDKHSIYSANPALPTDTMNEQPWNIATKIYGVTQPLYEEACFMLVSYSLYLSSFSPEYRRDIFHRNVGWLSPDHRQHKTEDFNHFIVGCSRLFKTSAATAPWDCHKTHTWLAKKLRVKAVIMYTAFLNRPLIQTSNTIFRQNFNYNWCWSSSWRRIRRKARRSMKELRQRCRIGLFE